MRSRERSKQVQHTIERRVNPVTGRVYWVKIFKNPPDGEVRIAERLFGLHKRQDLTRKQRQDAARRIAAVLFAEPVSGGRPKDTGRWNRNALFKLGGRFHQIEVEHPRTRRRTSYFKWAELIKSRWPEDYQHDEPSNIRKWLPKARRIFESPSAKFGFMTRALQRAASA